MAKMNSSLLFACMKTLFETYEIAWMCLFNNVSNSNMRSRKCNFMHWCLVGGVTFFTHQKICLCIQNFQNILKVFFKMYAIKGNFLIEMVTLKVMNDSIKTKIIMHNFKHYSKFSRFSLTCFLRKKARYFRIMVNIVQISIVLFSFTALL